MNELHIADQILHEITVGKQKVEQPHVIILMGLQYSGKSYVANQLSERNYAYFWATKIKQHYGIDNSHMLELANEVLQNAIEEGFNIVIDYVNQKYDIRHAFQETAASLNTKYTVVFLDTPKDVRMQRRAANILTGDMPGRRVISMDQITEFEEEFEHPRDNEPTVTLISDNDIAYFLARIR